MLQDTRVDLTARCRDAPARWAHRTPPAEDFTGRCNIPIILVTGKAELDDRLQGLELGADDFISKPFEVPELVARVRTAPRRSQQMRDVSPLTGLPGNFRIAAELETRVKSGEPFALVDGDLDNFKAFNDHYGFMRGDQVISFCARSMLDAAAETGDPSAFVGHIGGDDFVALMGPDVVESFCRNAIKGFDAGSSPATTRSTPSRATSKLPTGAASGTPIRSSRCRWAWLPTNTGTSTRLGGFGDRGRDEGVRQATRQGRASRSDRRTT